MQERNENMINSFCTRSVSENGIKSESSSIPNCMAEHLVLKASKQ